MTVQLMTTSDPINKLNKSVTVVETLADCKPVEPFDIINPVYRIRYNVNYLSSINYCYCTETGRYYYIDSITILTGDILEISCHVDVLMSYRTAINNVNVIAERSSNKYNKYLHDGTISGMSTVQLQHYKFPVSPFAPSQMGLSSGKCFLVALGKS